VWGEIIPVLSLAESVLHYFGSAAIRREQFSWNGCGTRSPDLVECKFYVAIPRAVFSFEPAAIHSRESARNIQPFFTADGFFFRESLRNDAPLVCGRVSPSIKACNSFFGTTSSAKPQSELGTTLGNTHTVSLSRPSRPGKWIFISVLNVLWGSAERYTQPGDSHLGISLVAKSRA
jgi:hypothetical protein